MNSISNNRLINARQASELLGVSVSYAYKLVDELNSELTQAGYLTIRGKVDSLYLKKRFFPSEESLSLLNQNSEGGDRSAAV